MLTTDLTQPKRIEHIELIFENTDYVKIPFEYIMDIEFDDVKTNYNINFEKEFTKDLILNKGIIEFKKEVLELTTHFNEIMKQHEGDERYIQEPILVRDYLKTYRDITYIEIYFTDDTHLVFVVEWNIEDYYSNRYQGYKEIDDRVLVIFDVDSNFNKDEK